MNVIKKYEPIRYNVKQTKNEYSKVNNLAIKGLEVVTYAHNTKEEVSHIKKAIFDSLLKHVTFTLAETYDEELQGWTVSVPEIDLYGEGNTKEAAVSDLINSIHEYISLYTESNFLSQHESPEKQAAIIKLMRCENDEAMRNALGLK
ncbi:hypothetical protein [Sporomusa termitida]|uniref:Antitoxin of toxin-antitoxin, RelE / RelB, TA system n=1 Tax=Sporomusa termitida TaxID=2377 RepID=A0A517DUQ7_9FIRM|nr:hypothetical protein [Sporomusa termitida]QDR81092.1 Antitoxin of toxin-antitoxin, RelE / RelB, TA system [Sporomusa termitida]